MLSAKIKLVPVFFNLSLVQDRVLPSCWKIAYVISILKKGKSNYRV